MKLIIIAGPPTCGKTTVIRQVVRRILKKNFNHEKGRFRVASNTRKGTHYEDF